MGFEYPIPLGRIGKRRNGWYMVGNGCPIGAPFFMAFDHFIMKHLSKCNGGSVGQMPLIPGCHCIRS